MNDYNKKAQVFAYKLKNDRVWYMENFLKIRDKNAKLVPFKVNDAQKKFNDIIEKNTKEGKPHRYIILKARQLGMSTFTEGLIYHKTSTNELENSLIIAHEDKATQNLFSMSKMFYEESPLSIRPMKKHSNEKALTFENPTQNDVEKKSNPGLRSKITVATAGTQDTGRSTNITNLHVSEIAFFPNPKNTMTALLQCVPDTPNSFVIMESTANGVGGYFYDMWNQAVEGLNDFTPVFFPWFSDATYTKEFETKQEKKEFESKVNQMISDSSGKLVHTDEWMLMKEYNLTLEQMHWRERTIYNKCNGDLDMFKQEYPSTPQEAFIASGRPRFDLRAVKEYELNCEKPLYIGDIVPDTKTQSMKFVSNPTGYLEIWNTPIDGQLYCIGADVAEGLEKGDYSVAHVIDEHLNIVAKWKGHIDPDLFGDELVNLSMFYNDGYIAVENNNHGLTTLKAIVRREYYNLFYTKTYDKVYDTINKKLGWSTNTKTKPMMIDRLAEYIREHYIGLKSLDTVMEMYSYVIDEKGKTNAQEGKHDDCVMSLGITLMAFLEDRGADYTPEITDTNGIKNKKDNDVPEIIDPLFEDGEDVIECT